MELERTDTEVFALLNGDADYNSFLFGTSWFMTWFAHDIKSWANLQRLFDLFLSRKPYFVVHFITAFISENRPALEEFLEQGFDAESLPFVAFKTPL